MSKQLREFQALWSKVEKEPAPQGKAGRIDLKRLHEEVMPCLKAYLDNQGKLPEDRIAALDKLVDRLDAVTLCTEGATCDHFFALRWLARLALNSVQAVPY